MSKTSEVRIIVDPTGLKKIELYGLPNDTESEETALEIYCQLASIIHRFGKHAQEILHGVTKQQKTRYADNG